MHTHTAVAGKSRANIELGSNDVFENGKVVHWERERTEYPNYFFHKLLCTPIKLYKWNDSLYFH